MKSMRGLIFGALVAVVLAVFGFALQEEPSREPARGPSPSSGSESQDGEAGLHGQGPSQSEVDVTGAVDDEDQVAAPNGFEIDVSVPGPDPD